MKKFLVPGILVLVALVGGGIYAVNMSSSPSSPSQEGVSSENIPSDPWAEVITSKIVNLPAGSNQSQELQTGDIVMVNSTVTVNSTGFGNIYLPDGSVLRADSGAKFTITQGSFDPKTEKLTFRIALAAGRLWSKVFGLATPDSTWEVQTSNAVATVRGTALDVSYVNGKTTILGSTGTVVVNVLDPKTGKVVKESAATITPHTMLVVNDADISGIASGKIALAASPAPSDILNQSWVTQAENADAKFDAMRDQLKAQGLQGPALRERFIKEVTQPFASAIAAQKLQTSNETPIVPIETNTTPTRPTATSTPAPYPTALKLTTSNPLTNVTEGDSITFVATVIWSDGSQKVMTGSATWQVVGSVGSVARGIFTAKLDPSVAEYGQAQGAIVASWKDPVSGANVFNKTPLFTVNAYVAPMTGAPQG